MVTSDPRAVTGQYGDRVMLRGRVRARRPGAAPPRGAAPVLVIGDETWRGVRLGSTVALRAGWRRRDDHDLAAVLTALGPPATAGRAVGVVARRGARCARRSATPWPTGRTAQRALVPALVTGDDARRPSRPGGGLPHLGPDPPAGGLGHQPDAGGRVPGAGRRAGAGCGGGGSTCVAALGDRRLRAAGPDRAERAPGGGDGHGRAARAGRQRPRPRRARPRCRGHRAAAGATRAGGLARLRAVACWPPRASCCSPRRGATRWPLAAPVGGRGGRGARRRAAGLHAGGGRALRAGQPGRGGRQPARGARWSPRRRCSGCRAGCVGLVSAARRPAGSARSPAWCVAWIVAVARRSAALPAAAVDWGTGRRRSRC